MRQYYFNHQTTVVNKQLPSPTAVRAHLKQIGKRSLVLSQHAVERMKERGITEQMILDAINNGTVSSVDQPTRDEAFRCTVLSPPANGEQFNVALALNSLVITVITVGLKRKRRA